MKRLICLVTACVVVFAGLALAEEKYELYDSRVVGERAFTLPSSRSGDCVLGLYTTGSLRAFNPFQAYGAKVWLDPATDQVGQEQCTPPYYPFRINSVTFWLYTRQGTAPEQIVGKTITYLIDIECPANMGTGYPDKCNGPGTSVCQFTWSHTFTQADWDSVLVEFTAELPEPCCVNGPFFVGMERIAWDGELLTSAPFLVAGSTANAPLWDCRIWAYFRIYFGNPAVFWPSWCWSNIPSDFGGGGWGPWTIWVSGTSEADCTPEVCRPCRHRYGDDETNPILITSSHWTRVINFCGFCPDYDQRIPDPGGSFTGAGADMVLELQYPLDMYEACFTITITPLCSDSTFFRLRSWMMDAYGYTGFDGVPRFPGPFQGQVYNFTGANCFQLDQLTNWIRLYVDVRNAPCCCPVRITYEGDTPLPVELVSFGAVGGDGEVTLTWQTRSELGVQRYEILRHDGVTYRKDSYGDSPTGNFYRFVDRDVENGVTYSYTLSAVDMDGAVRVFPNVATATPQAGVVTEYALEQNYPNPFNPTTAIRYAVKDAGLVTLKVYTVDGREVATLVNKHQESGTYSVTFDGSALASGVYLYRLAVNGFTATHKMVLMK